MKQLFIPIPGSDQWGPAHMLRQVAALLLLICMLLFGAGVTHALLGIRQHNTQLEQRNYEVPWSLMQLQLEMNRFFDAVRLLNAGVIEHDELMLRYDILWSRTPVLLSNQLKDTLSERPDLWLLIQQIEDRVRSVEPMVQALKPGDLNYRLLLAELAPYAEPLARTVTATMHSNVLFYAEYDKAYKSLSQELYVCTLGLGFCALLLLLMLWLELLSYRRRLLQDALTGLPNRFALQHRLGQLIGRRQPFSITLLELEDLDWLVQHFGYDTADQLQSAFARRLQACLLPHEHIALFERKCVVVAEGVLELAEVRAQLSRVRQALAAPEAIARHDFHPTPVIGVVLYPADADNMVDLLARGELALALCRQERLPYVIFDPSMLKEIERRQQLARDLPAALESDSLSLRFHPLADGEGRCAGFRLSLQWRHPHFGMITGPELGRLAEQYQLSEALLLWALNRCCELLPGWQALQSGLFVSLPLPPSLFRSSIRESLLAALKQHGLDGTSLVLELEEAQLEEELHLTQPLVRELRERGIRIMLANFGSGRSSWGQLTRLPLDWLQLDVALCNGIEREGEARRQFQAMLALARLLALPVICCGVHREAEVQVIREQGQAPLLQGDVVSPPLGAIEVKDWLEARS